VQALLRRKEAHAKNPHNKRKQDREYYQRNSKRLKAYQKEYLAKNWEAVQQRKRQYYSRNQERIKEYRQQNREKIRQYMQAYRRQRTISDVEFRLVHTLRTRIYRAIKKQGTTKSTKSIDLLGTTISQVRAHLESQFLPGMTWENHGKSGWHIDHIRPCASFDLTDPIQQKECFHYTNLQPLWATDNLKKSAKY